MALKYDFCKNFRNGLALVQLGDKYGFINDKGEEVVEIKYDFCKNFRNGLALVQLGNKYGFVNDKGEEITK